jgi:sugar transferase (PEP-CTERM system associated)
MSLFAVLCIGSMLLAVALQLGPYGVSARHALVPAFEYAAIMTALGTMFGLFRAGERKTLAIVVSRTLMALAVGLPLTYALLSLAPDGQSARSVLAYVALFTVAAVITVRPTVLAAVDAGAGARRMLIIGTGADAQAVQEVIDAQGSRRAVVVGFYPAGPDELPMGDRPGKVPCFPSTLQLPTIVERFKVDEVIVAVREQRGGVLPIRDLLECRIAGVPVRDLSAFYEKASGEVPIDSLKASWLIYGGGFIQSPVRTFIKRLFDMVISFALLVLALPVIVLAAIAILAESGAPILFTQERVGRGGRVFRCFKLRTMRTDAEKDGIARWAMANDSRITRVGRLLRKLRIDEIPQLVNVLRGEMSLVGPRPERPCFVGQLKDQIRFYDVRHSIKPGVTGWAQVRYSYGSSVEDAQRKLQFDLYYVKNHTLTLDILILVETVRVVLFGEGAQ